VVLGIILSLLPDPRELRELRKRAGLTQKELARRAGVSQSLIARIEAGTVDPRLSTMRRILRALEDFVNEELRAEDVMASPVITVYMDSPIEEVVDLMWRHGISQIPVLSKCGHVIGTVYEKTVVEILLKYRERALGKRAGDIMSAPLPMVSPKERLSTVAKILGREMPAVLVAEGGRLLGIITHSDLMRNYLTLFKKRAHERA